MKVVEHRPPYKRVDLGHIGRPRTVTREDIENNVHREPCAEAYRFDPNWRVWVLKDAG